MTFRIKSLTNVSRWPLPMKTDGESRSFQFGSRCIRYSLYRSDRKRLRIVVSPDQSVEVVAPNDQPDEQVVAAIQKKAPWISRKLAELEKFQPVPEPKSYISGETIAYLGRQYRLKVRKGPQQPAKLIGRFLYVWVENKSDTDKIKKAVDDWYRLHAQSIFSRYLEKCCAITSRHGVPEPVMAVRLMTRRWGSCSPKGRITLNVYLVMAPVHCIEYVIMHELCHLKYHNHSKSFYSLLNRCMPDWQRRKERLERY